LSNNKEFLNVFPRKFNFLLTFLLSDSSIIYLLHLTQIFVNTNTTTYLGNIYWYLLTFSAVEQQ